MKTPTLAQVIQKGIDHKMLDMHTAIPGRVERYDASKQLIDAKPLIKQSYEDETGSTIVESLPIIVDIPVVFPGSNGYRVTFPVTKGDIVLLVFAEGSLDKWLNSGIEVDPLDYRRFNLSDAIAIPGLRSFNRAFSNTPTSGMSMGKDVTTGEVIQINGDIKAGGTGSVPLATKPDIDALITAVNNLVTAYSAHTHTVPIIGPAGTTPTTPPLVPGVPAAPAAGTTVLKGK